MSTLSQSLRTWAVRDVVVDRRARQAVGIVAFALATVFGAQVAVPVPLTPVPITLQTLFVILAGVVMGPRAGAASMALYVGAGALGAPVFSNGGAGLGWLLGPTGGVPALVSRIGFRGGVGGVRMADPRRLVAGVGRRAHARRARAVRRRALAAHAAHGAPVR
jgi:hypothetical protein